MSAPQRLSSFKTPYRSVTLEGISPPPIKGMVLTYPTARMIRETFLKELETFEPLSEPPELAKPTAPARVPYTSWKKATEYNESIITKYHRTSNAQDMSAPQRLSSLKNPNRYATLEGISPPPVKDMGSTNPSDIYIRRLQQTELKESEILEPLTGTLELAKPIAPARVPYTSLKKATEYNESIKSQSATPKSSTEMFEATDIISTAAITSPKLKPVVKLSNISAKTSSPTNTNSPEKLNQKPMFANSSGRETTRVKESNDSLEAPNITISPTAVSTSTAEPILADPTLAPPIETKANTPVKSVPNIDTKSPPQSIANPTMVPPMETKANTSVKPVSNIGIKSPPTSIVRPALVPPMETKANTPVEFGSNIGIKSPPKSIVSPALVPPMETKANTPVEFVSNIGIKSPPESFARPAMVPPMETKANTSVEYTGIKPRHESTTSPILVPGMKIKADTPVKSVSDIGMISSTISPYESPVQHPISVSPKLVSSLVKRDSPIKTESNLDPVFPQTTTSSPNSKNSSNLPSTIHQNPLLSPVTPAIWLMASSCLTPLDSTLDGLWSPSSSCMISFGDTMDGSWYPHV